ncbi:MAG: DUF4395 domain-containing protein [Bacteroidales bacterium]
MVKICPISVKRINENLSRLNASFTLLMSILFLLTWSPFFMMVIVMDFILRNIMEGKLNPVTRFNNYLITVIHIPEHLINAGPKIFAARVGLLLGIAGTFFLFMGNHVAVSVIIGMLGIFSFLESAFNYCVACKLYPYLLPLNRIFDRGK